MVWRRETEGPFWDRPMHLPHMEDPSWTYWYKPLHLGTLGTGLAELNHITHLCQKRGWVMYGWAMALTSTCKNWVWG